MSANHRRIPGSPTYAAPSTAACGVRSSMSSVQQARYVDGALVDRINRSRDGVFILLRHRLLRHPYGFEGRDAIGEPFETDRPSVLVGGDSPVAELDARTARSAACVPTVVRHDLVGPSDDDFAEIAHALGPRVGHFRVEVPNGLRSTDWCAFRATPAKGPFSASGSTMVDQACWSSRLKASSSSRVVSTFSCDIARPVSPDLEAALAIPAPALVSGLDCPRGEASFSASDSWTNERRLTRLPHLAHLRRMPLPAAHQALPSHFAAHAASRIRSSCPQRSPCHPLFDAPLA